MRGRRLDCNWYWKCTQIFALKMGNLKWVRGRGAVIQLIPSMGWRWENRLPLSSPPADAAELAAAPASGGSWGSRASPRPTDPNTLEDLPRPSCPPVLDGAGARASTRKAARRCRWPPWSPRVTEIKSMDVSRLIIYSGTLGSDALKRTAGCQQHIYQEFKRQQQPYNPEDLMTEWNECWINALFDKLTNIWGNATAIYILLGEINKLRISWPFGDQILWMCIFQSNLLSLVIRGKQNMKFSTCKKLQIFAMQLACHSILHKSGKKNLLHTQNVLWNRNSSLVYSETIKWPYQNLVLVTVKNVWIKSQVFIVLKCFLATW